MIAFFRDGIPSVGVYLISPVFYLAAELRIAVLGALFFGSPTPRWMTGSPFERNNRASSFSFRVGEVAIDRASWLMLIGLFFSSVKFDKREFILILHDSQCGIVHKICLDYFVYFSLPKLVM